MAQGVKEIDVGIGMRGLAKAMKKLKDLELFIGYDGSSGAEIHSSGSSVNVATIAFFQAFGTREFEASGTIPPRDFMELGLVDNQEKIAREYQKTIGRILEGKSPEGELAKLGVKVVKMIRKKLDTAASWAAPLAPSTLERKTGPGMLRETDKMRNALGWFVKKGERIVKEGK